MDEDKQIVQQIEPPKVQKKLPTRVWISYILMTGAIVGIVVFAVAFMMGYRLSPSGEIARTGLVQVDSSPTRATISVDGNQIGSRTGVKLSLDEGEHWIEVRRDGYGSWQGHYNIKMDDILWLDYIVLFPLELKTIEVADFKLLPLQIIEPNRIIAEDEAKALYTVDFSKNEYQTQKLNFTWQELQTQMGEKTKLQKIIATNNDNNFWLVGSDNTIYVYSANNKTLTQVGVDKRIVASAFYFRDLVFVAQDAEGKFEMYFYQTGDVSPVYWKTLDKQPAIMFSNYDNVNYLAVSGEGKTEIYANPRGRFYENAELSTTITESGNLSFSPNGRFLHVANKNYDIENEVIYENITARNWFNGELVSQVSDGKFLVSDFDGQNLRELAIEPIGADNVFLSDNDRRLYYFDKDKKLVLVDLERE